MEERQGPADCLRWLQVPFESLTWLRAAFFSGRGGRADGPSRVYLTSLLRAYGGTAIAERFTSCRLDLFHGGPQLSDLPDAFWNQSTSTAGPMSRKQ